MSDKVALEKVGAAWMNAREEERLLLERVLEIYDQKWIGTYLNGVSPDRWCRETINRWAKGKASPTLRRTERQALEALLPSPPSKPGEFDFIDLFAGIGGLRRAFEAVGGRCILTSEWNKEAVRTYRANYHCDPQHHRFNSDIRDLTLSNRPEVGDKDAYRHIDLAVPNHDVLLAGFPCQPFSIAGVSKKNSLGRAHGFECKTQGTLFFDVARILAVKRPAAFVLENVKNLRTHDGGRTFKVVVETLSELGYWVSDMIYPAGKDPKIVDAQHFVPQHRERVVLVGFRKDIGVHEGFTLRDIRKHFLKSKPKLGDILESEVDPKYILTERLWEYLFNYSIEHKKRGNGFGFGLVSAESVTRTLSARYYKDGSEILVDRGFNPKRPIGSPKNVKNRPRRLTPRECARLMGFDKPNGSAFRIPVSDTQAYKQFGNSVVVPVFSTIAKIMKPRIMAAKARETCRPKSAIRRKRA